MVCRPPPRERRAVEKALDEVQGPARFVDAECSSDLQQLSRLAVGILLGQQRPLVVLGQFVGLLLRGRGGRHGPREEGGDEGSDRERTLGGGEAAWTGWDHVAMVPVAVGRSGGLRR